MPFGPYRDFDDCVAKNRDKRNPKGYCGEVQRRAEGSLTLVDVTTFRVDVPRDGHGRWCKGAGCQEGTGVIVVTDDPAVFAKLSPEARLTAPQEWFASDAEWNGVQQLAEYKAITNPRPTAAQIKKNKRAAAKAKKGGRAGGELRGNSYTRRERGEALFAEFGGKKRGYVPCTYCGIKTAPGGRGGHAHMEQDKLLTLHEGGTYGTAKGGFPNLIPSCSGCNKHRGDNPYPIRPYWETPYTGTGAGTADIFNVPDPRSLVAAAGAHSTLIGQVVVAFPIYWDDPEPEGIGRPVEGELLVRTVDTPFGPYEQWIVGGEVVEPETVRALDDPALTASGAPPDGAAVRAHAVGWDGRLTDDTDWALDRTDLPLLSTQIGTLVITHVADLDYDQYTVNGVPVDPDTITPLTDFGLVASVCANCGLPRRLDFGVDQVPRDDHGRWTRRGGSGGSVVADKTRDAEADGSTVSPVLGDETGELSGQLDDLTELIDDPEFANSQGVKLTRGVLDDTGLLEDRWVSHVEGLGIGGALGGYSATDSEFLGGNPPSFIVDSLGTTGIADGVGSQLYGRAVLMAAGRGHGILGEPLEGAKPFWTKMGWVEDPNGVGTSLWGLTPQQVQQHARSL